MVVLDNIVRANMIVLCFFTHKLLHRGDAHSSSAGTMPSKKGLCFQVLGAR
jgi:hypothetical protein